MEERYIGPTSTDAGFESLFANSNAPSSDSGAEIPRVAHFIYPNGRQVGWPEWLAIRGAFVNLGVEKAILWLQTGEKIEGAMWKRIQSMERVEIQRLTMPEKVYGHDIPDKHRSDIARLKILWEQGGIYLDSDLVALKSSDDILRTHNDASTIMAWRFSPEGIPNWLIMSKAGSPVLKKWMQKYEGEWDLSNDESTWKDNSWEKMALEAPVEMARNGDPHLRVLNGHSWFYPLSSELDGDVTLKKLWFGKSWDSIGDSYGTHVWHWNEAITKLATPAIIRLIDTPLFCQLRSLFDDLDGDGYAATASEKDANCSIATTKNLKTKHHRLFSDYRMTDDQDDAKWIDFSGHYLHGWAPTGTPLRSDDSGGAYRLIGKQSLAVLPVPRDWDTRTWTVRMDILLDPRALDGEDLVGLFKIRTENDGDIVVRVGTQQGSGYIMDVEWRDVSRAKAAEVLTVWKSKHRGYIKAPNLRQVQLSWHHMAITYDRQDKGELGLYLDGVQLGTQPLPLQEKPNFGQDIWINARDWNEVDMGFRGSLRRFTMYADALTAENINKTIPASSASTLKLPALDLQNVPVTKSQGSVLFVLIAVMAVSLFLVRTKRVIFRDGLWHAREGIIHIRHRFFAK